MSKTRITLATASFMTAIAFGLVMYSDIAPFAYGIGVGILITAGSLWANEVPVREALTEVQR